MSGFESGSYPRHLGIIAGLFTLVFTCLLGRRWGGVAALLGISLYTILIGASASVLRAAIMGGFALPLEWIGNLQPQVALYQFSAADQEGLPSPETLELLQG